MKTLQSNIQINTYWASKRWKITSSYFYFENIQKVITKTNKQLSSAHQQARIDLLSIVFPPCPWRCPPHGVLPPSRPFSSTHRPRPTIIELHILPISTHISPPVYDSEKHTVWNRDKPDRDYTSSIHRRIEPLRILQERALAVSCWLPLDWAPEFIVTLSINDQTTSKTPQTNFPSTKASFGVSRYIVHIQSRRIHISCISPLNVRSVCYTARHRGLPFQLRAPSYECLGVKRESVSVRLYINNKKGRISPSHVSHFCVSGF